jgi:hypothetical protein
MSLVIGFGWIYENQTMSIAFVDEEENFVNGKNLLEGNKMYDNIFSQHQPIPYLLSAGIQKFTKPNGLLMLVKRHREVVFVWAVGWWILMGLKFGWWTGGVAVIFETIKWKYLGHLFLAESLVAYPVLFLILGIGKSEKNKWQLFVWGTVWGFCWWTLAPLWPLLGVLILIKIFGQKGKGIGWVGGGVAILTMVALWRTNIGGWYEAMIVTAKYYVPLTNQGGALGNLLDGFIKPLKAILLIGKSEEVVIEWLAVVWLLGIVKLILRKKYRLAILLWIILALSDTRKVGLDKVNYEGFHLIVWIIVIIGTGIMMWWQETKRGWWVVALGIALVWWKSGAILTKKNNLYDEWFTRYSWKHTWAEAAKILNQNDNQEKMLVVPDESVIYWQTGIKPASRFIFYYGWMEAVPKFREEVRVVMEDKTPTYLVYEKNGESQIDRYLNKYRQLKQNGKEIPVYVEVNKSKKITTDQKNQLKYFEVEL